MISECAIMAIFWCSVGLLGYTFIGYPVVMMFLARTVKEPDEANNQELLNVSVVIVMGDEAENARDRIRNILENGYPHDKMEIVVVVDGTHDDTQQLLESLQVDELKLLPVPEHRGKSACLNDGVAMASGELLILCDARQRFRPGAIDALARRFAEPNVGAVSGELIIEGGDMGAYWRFEKALRKAESRLGSVIGCTGAIYAIRKELFKAIPDDTILDDVVIPMLCVTTGHSVKFDANAVAVDSQPASMEFETRRKIRTLAGNWQMLFRYPSWLFPWVNRSCFQLICHKYLRLAGPFLLTIAFLANLALTDPLYRILLAGQGAVYALAWAGLAFPELRFAPVRLAATFVYLNWLNAAAFPAWLSGSYRRGWGEVS